MSEPRQPPLETRIEHAYSGIPTYLRASINERKFRRIVCRTMKKSIDYSLAEYNVYGLSDCISQIINDIEHERKKIIHCLPF